MEKFSAGTFRYIFLVTGLVILAYLVVNFNNRTAELSKLSAEHAVVEAEWGSKLLTKEALVEKIAYATSDAAVFRWAYENHMIRPGDIPVVPVAALQPTPTPAPRPVVTQMATSNFDRWLLLFFDPD